MHSINQKIILIFPSIIFFLPSFIYSSNKTTNIPLEDRLIILCSDAPEQLMKIFCEQLHKSDIIARVIIKIKNKFKLNLKIKEIFGSCGIKVRA